MVTRLSCVTRLITVPPETEGVVHVCPMRAWRKQTEVGGARWTGF